MAVSLNAAKQLSQDKLSNYIIDEFAKSPIMSELMYDNTVKPQGGKSLAYVYNRISTQPTAGARTLNGEYTAQEAATTQHTVNLKVMGGSYEIDRVIAEDEKQVVDEVEFQTSQKAKATAAEFANLMVNGDAANNAAQFDGIEVSLNNSTIIDGTGIDFTNASATKNSIDAFLYALRQLNKKMGATPTHYLMNGDVYAAFQSIADFNSNVRFTRDEMGNEIGFYGATKLVNMGDKPGTANPIVSISNATNVAAGKTALYAVRLGMDGVHAVTPDGSSLVKNYLPDFNTPGAVKKGEVEFVGAIAIKSDKAIGKISNIAVTPVLAD